MCNWQCYMNDCSTFHEHYNYVHARATNWLATKLAQFAFTHHNAQHFSSIYIIIYKYMLDICFHWSSPAVNHNRMIASLPLYFSHLRNHICHCLEVTTTAIRGPVSDMELCHLVRLASLIDNRECAQSLRVKSCC